MLKRFFNQIEHYWSSGQQQEQSAQSASIVASKSVRPSTAMLHSTDAMSPCSPSHSFHEGLAQLAHGQQRSDPNTLPHCWTVSSHGTMDRGLSDIVELRNLSAAAARPRQMLSTRWGHRFLLTSLDLPTYCDFCGQVLFGLAHRCEYCSTSCHTVCSERLCLSCRRPSPFNRDKSPDGNQADDLSPFDVFETAKSDLWMAVSSQSAASTAAKSATSSVSTTNADDQEAVAYTPRLRSQQQQSQQSCQKRRRKRRTRTSSADTLLSGQNSLLLTAGGDCDGTADKVDDHPLNSDSVSSSDDDATPNGSDCGEDFYSTASTDMSSIMSSLPPPPSPPSSVYRRRQQLHEPDECQYSSLLSSEAAYSLSSLDTASLAQAGIRVLESASATSSEAAADGLSVASVSEAGVFYCDWTPERLRRHLAELTARLPGQEFRIVRSNSVCEDSLANVEPAESNSRPQQFRGSLRVHVNLLRPVRAEQPAAAFFLPRGNATLLHDLDSRDTADRIVSLLLAKHRIRDPPHKFALFEHEIRGDKTVIVRKLMQHERPLEILLSWTTLPPDEMRLAFERRKFILQENESSTVDWHAFTIPELNNFLLILSLEEEQRAKEVRLTFDITRAQLRRRMFELEKQRQQQQHQNSSATDSIKSDV